MNEPVLSLFPGIGLLDHAFEAEGFVVYRGPDVIWGGDIRRFHPNPGLFRGVIGGPPCQSFSSLAHLVRANGHEPKFGNLIPEFERCVAEAQPDWFVMENVPQAPEPVVPGYGVKSFLLDNSQLPGDDGDGFGQEQRRVRRFSFGMRGAEPPSLLRWIDLATFFLPDATRTSTSWPVNNSKERKTRRQAILTSNEAVPVAIGGSGKVKRTRQVAVNAGHGGAPARPGKGGKITTHRFADALRLQGLPENWLDHCPMTAEGKLKAVANGVPIPMGRAIARAVREAT